MLSDEYSSHPEGGYAHHIRILLRRTDDNVYYRAPPLDGTENNLDNSSMEEQEERIIYIATGGELTDRFECLR